METADTIAAPTALRVLIGGFCALALAMGIGRFALSPLLPTMMHDAGVSRAEGGLLASATFLAYLVGTLGFASVREGGRRLLFALSVAASVASTALMGCTTSFTAWVLLRALSGLASAGAWLPAASIVMETLARADRTPWNGVLYSGSGFGIVWTGILVPPLIARFGWRGGWIGMGLCGLLFALPALAWTRASARARRDAAAEAAPEVEKADPPSIDRHRPRMFARLAAAVFLEGFSYSAFATFLVAVVQKAASGGSAAGAWTVVGVTAALAAAIIPLSALRFRLSFLLAVLFAMQAVGIALPLALPGPIGAYGGSVLFGGSFLPIAALTILAGRRLSERRISTSRVVALLTVLLGIGQAAGPLVGGYLAQRSGYAPPLLIAAGVSALGGLLMGINWFGEARGDAP